MSTYGGWIRSNFDQLDSLIDQESIDVEIEIIESSASSAIECIIRELFRIYEPLLLSLIV